jgi:hypothetical protein
VPVPEGAIALNVYLKVKRIRWNLAKPTEFKVAFKNISEAPFDSVKVKFVITDRNNVPHIIPTPRRRPLLISRFITDRGVDQYDHVTGSEHHVS